MNQTDRLETENEAVDLTTLCDSLSSYSKYKPLVGSVRRFHGVMSVEYDLKESKECIRAIAPDPRSKPDGLTINSALMSHAVILYCRALHSGTTRSAFDPKQLFKGDFYAKHRNIVDLRDSAVAHFVNGRGRYGTAWIKERVVLCMSDAGDTLTVPYMRASYLTNLTKDIVELIDHATPSIEAAKKERAREVEERLADLVTSDTDFRQLFNAAQFNPADFYGQDTDAARLFWTERSGQVNELFQSPPRI